jgi:hypothetical protein
LIGQQSNGYIYQCEFQGLAGTKLATPSIKELVACVQTLEAYELQGNHTPPYDLDEESEYPAEQQILFQSIEIITNGGPPEGLSSGTDYVTQYGEHTTIIEGGPSEGEVAIQFHR